MSRRVIRIIILFANYCYIKFIFPMICVNNGCWIELCLSMSWCHEYIRCIWMVLRIKYRYHFEKKINLVFSFSIFKFTLKDSREHIKNSIGSFNDFYKSFAWRQPRFSSLNLLDSLPNDQYSIFGRVYSTFIFYPEMQNFQSLLYYCYNTLYNADYESRIF